MADVSYTRNFSHQDWIDNEDVVQAGGEKGFNTKFHAIEDEFDDISTAVTELNTQIKSIQQLKFVTSQSTQTLAADATTAEFLIERYSRDELPDNNLDKAYFVVIFPVSGPTHIQHSILYRNLPGDEVAASVQFYNPGSSQARFSFRVMNLAVQST